MLTRDQVYTLLILRKRGVLFGGQPNDINIIYQIIDYGQDPNNRINCALRLAASGLQTDIANLAMAVMTYPRLLLQAGNVITRGGVEVIRTTLLEFFLGEGDPVGAEAIKFGFDELSKIKDKDGQFLDGKKEYNRQCERYRPHIEALAKQIRAKRSTIDVKPLLDMIKHATDLDIRETTDDFEGNTSTVCLELKEFRHEIIPKQKTVGMHYNHYTTLMQAYRLLASEWGNLCELFDIHESDENYQRRYDLIWRQIICILQIYGLPAVDRMCFARMFCDNTRTLNYIFDQGDSFPNAPVSSVSELHKLDRHLRKYVDIHMPYSYLSSRLAWGFFNGQIKSHMSSKISGLEKLMPKPATTAGLLNRVHNWFK